MMEDNGLQLLGMLYKDPISSFGLFHKFAVENQEVYWKLVPEELSMKFLREPKSILDASDISMEEAWFPGPSHSTDVCICYQTESRSQDLWDITKRYWTRRLMVFSKLAGYLQVCGASKIQVRTPCFLGVSINISPCWSCQMSTDQMKNDKNAQDYFKLFYFSYIQPTGVSCSPFYRFYSLRS
ncbi:uncharacterized protein LOC119366208 [Triticum dicoccoides]|uniref:uncharacterized protein LOC119366208 n=1 Tax=Triticum dicoccoides TaxID=85692 RepID=UPI00188E8018|nr:uncharacterized protein LOC119366208 [Triticum dicoccoides]XP_037487796.1 uncharacterized protein LOC119366208 [Triticum dicoccoides]XP_044326681.1 uncharacterized protein LOC123047249 [Triticum aestivum]XP_044326682.1 uncharacterized protein LOC123047249 [Triticum aestivum]